MSEEIKISEVFEHKKMNENQISTSDLIRHYATELLNAMSDFCPECRERSIAITKLEECIMWANKSISHGKHI